MSGPLAEQGQAGDDGKHIPAGNPPAPSEGSLRYPSVQMAKVATHGPLPGRPDRHQEREPDIPGFDGKDTREYRTYKKKVAIWRELTATPNPRQALKLLTGLEGEAWRAAEDLDFELLKTDDGPRILEERLDELMGIQRDNEMMKVIDDFYFATPRRESEEI